MQWISGIWWWGHCLSCKKVKPEDAVDAVCIGLVVYGGGDIVFDAKRSNQWIQWMQSHSGHSTQWTQYAVDTVDIVFDAKTSNQWIQWMQSHSGHSTQWMQWMQYAVDAVRSGHSRIVGIWWWGHCL